MATKKKDFTNPTGLFISQAQPTEERNTENFKVPEGYKLVRESKNKRLQLLVTPTIDENLRNRAVEESTSLNELCNRIFEEYLKGESK
jgi:hypothetical protein